MHNEILLTGDIDSMDEHDLARRLPTLPMHNHHVIATSRLNRNGNTSETRL